LRWQYVMSHHLVESDSNTRTVMMASAFVSLLVLIPMLYPHLLNRHSRVWQASPRTRRIQWALPT
jgi:hypothetical protein